MTQKILIFINKNKKILPIINFLKNSFDSKAHGLSGSPLIGFPIKGAFKLAKNNLKGSFPYYSTFFFVNLKNLNNLILNLRIKLVIDSPL